MKEDLQLILNRLRNCYENSGLTYKELEEKTGFPKSSIQRYVSGTTRRIPVNFIQAVAPLLGVTPDYLMGWDETNEKDNIFKKVREIYGENACEMLVLFSKLDRDEQLKELGRLEAIIEERKKRDSQTESSAG